MLLLSARASREIVKVIDTNTEALKDLKNEVSGMREALKRIEDLIPAQSKEKHNDDIQGDA